MKATSSSTSEEEKDFFDSTNLSCITNNNFKSPAPSSPIPITPCGGMFEMSQEVELSPKKPKSEAVKKVTEEAEDVFGGYLSDSEFANIPENSPEKKKIVSIPETPENECRDEHDCHHDAQHFSQECPSSLLDETTEMQRPVLPKEIFSPRTKSSYVRSLKRKRSEDMEFDPLTKTKNHLRVLSWRENPLSRIWNAKYPTNEKEGSENHLFFTSNYRNSFFVRITSSYRKPQKISIGSKSNKTHKVDFDVQYFDDILSAITSIQNGAKSKKVDIENKRRSINFTIGSQGELSIESEYTSAMSDYFSDENTEFTIPEGEFTEMLDCMLETKRFIGFLNEINRQYKKVFEVVADYYAENDGRCHQKDYYLKVVEIFYNMKTTKENAYPLNLLLEQFTKHYAHRSFYIKDM